MGLCGLKCQKSAYNHLFSPTFLSQEKLSLVWKYSAFIIYKWQPHIGVVIFLKIWRFLNKNMLGSSLGTSHNFYFKLQALFSWKTKYSSFLVGYFIKRQTDWLNVIVGLSILIWCAFLLDVSVYIVHTLFHNIVGWLVV